MLAEIETGATIGGSSGDGRVLRDLSAAVQPRDTAGADIVDAVRASRQAGESWTMIGAVLGVSRQAARQRVESLI